MRIAKRDYIYSTGQIKKNPLNWEVASKYHAYFYSITVWCLYFLTEEIEYTVISLPTASNQNSYIYLWGISMCKSKDTWKYKQSPTHMEIYNITP